MTILVAGATGLAGSAIVRELTRIDKTVVGISSRDLNLLDRKATFAFLNEIKPTTVIDAAAKVGGIGANNSYPVEFLSENIRIQTNLMDASHNAQVEKFVFLGSSCVYPKNCPQPIKEEYLLTGLLEPTNSAYALAKIAGIELINSYRKEFGHSWISVMPTNLYGPNDNFDLDNSHVLPALIRKIWEAKINKKPYFEVWGDGEVYREFTYSKDIANAMLFCLDNYTDSSPINIGNNEEYLLKDVILILKKHLNYNGEIIFDTSKPKGQVRKPSSNKKILDLGWDKSWYTPIDEGLKYTCEWFMNNYPNVRGTQK